MSEVFKICCYELKIQMMSKRVVLGYLVGMVMILKQSIGYIDYAQSLGEPINVLEPFIVAGNNPNMIIFFVVGWFLVISEAPFINNISFYIIYRTSRQIWNKAMVFYIIVQGIIFYGFMAFFTMVCSCWNGYLANVWSWPMIKVATGQGYVEAYNVNFPYPSYVESENVFGAFAHTFLLNLLYAVVLGMILYTFSLLFSRIVGPVVAFVFHFLGYELQAEGYNVMIKLSLLARSMPAVQIGKNALVNIFDTYLTFLIVFALLSEISNVLIRYTDYKEIAVEEGV